MSRDLIMAAGRGDTNEVKRLLEGGADANFIVPAGDRPTCLIVAAGEGHSEVVSILLDHGADIDATDTDGWTSLMCAVKQGRADTVRLLIERGADVNAPAEGVTPLKMILNIMPHVTFESKQVCERIAASLRAAGASETLIKPKGSSGTSSTGQDFIDKIKYKVTPGAEATNLAVEANAFHAGEGEAVFIAFTNTPPKLSLTGNCLLMQGYVKGFL